MKRLFIAAAAAAFVGVLAAQPTLTQSAPAEAQKQADAFAKTVAISDLFEIESSKLAGDKAQSADLKRFAQRMVTDHTKTTNELKSLVSSGKVKVTLPSQMDDEHTKKLQQLRSASGKDFDNTYRSQQVEAHREAVKLFEAYSKNGDNADLKNWAAQTLPHLKEHLSMIEGIKVSAINH